MSTPRENLLAGATAGCLAGLMLFARAHSLAWQVYGGLMLLLGAAMLLAAILARPARGHHHAPARHAARRLVTQGRIVVPLRRRS